MTTIPHSSDLLKEALEKKTAKIGVVGLGYVGLPLLQVFIEAGFQTLGFDLDEAKVAQLVAGKSYIQHVSDDWIHESVSQQRFEPTTQMDRLAEADAILICVPTPLTESREPDLRYIESTGNQIAAALRPGQLIILESTTYPGTTRDVLLPILEQSGLQAGQDFFLAYSPEREDPGNKQYSARSIPKVVGGIDALSLELANILYQAAVNETVSVSTCEVAEACKILENTYRSVNIAMVNELKVLFDRLGLNIWEVIDAAKTKPFGFQPFYPGPGLGGHCIPIDPFYLSWVARKHGLLTRFIELAGEINARMPSYVVERIAKALNEHRKPINGSRIGILGVAYKKDIDDPRESPAFKLMELLQSRGAILSYNDPFISRLPEMRHYDVPLLETQSLSREYLAGLDCVVITTDHSQYDCDFIVQHAPLVVDTRNATHSVV
ncbi:MAG TPA: nucleotide sugar dehydrogenase, partial [Planctomycetaceae bacterium]|nr:nucleotide sugar dehydrogenase [Planctomycetaceae bacterium]